MLSFRFRQRVVQTAERLESRDLLTGWGIEAIDAPDVWQQGYAGQGVVVAVIDSGIDAHSDLMPGLWRNQDESLNGVDDDHNGYVDDVNGWDFVDDDNSPLGSNSHGTHISGTIAAGRNRFGTTGVAHKARIMPLRIFTESGTGSTNDIASAIRYAADNGARVINLSIGGTETRNVSLALQYAAQQDVLVVAASGNDGAKSPTFPAVYSAELTNVISVGAHNESFVRVATSNGVGKSGAVQIDAPGANIMSTVAGNDYALSTGTSTAAAHVAGVAALAISANPDVSAKVLRSAIVAGSLRRVAKSDSRGAVNALRTVAIVSDLRSTPDADFDGNGVTDFGDFLVLAKNFGKANVGHVSGDANGDSKVQFSDFVVLAQDYGYASTDSRRGRAARAVSIPPPPKLDERLVDAAIAEVDEVQPILPADVLRSFFASSQ